MALKWLKRGTFPFLLGWLGLVTGAAAKGFEPPGLAEGWLARRLILAQSSGLRPDIKEA